MGLFFLSLFFGAFLRYAIVAIILGLRANRPRPPNMSRRAAWLGQPPRCVTILHHGWCVTILNGLLDNYSAMACHFRGAASQAVHKLLTIPSASGATSQTAHRT